MTRAGLLAAAGVTCLIVVVVFLVARWNSDESPSAAATAAETFAPVPDASDDQDDASKGDASDTDGDDSPTGDDGDTDGDAGPSGDTGGDDSDAGGDGDTGNGNGGGAIGSPIRIPPIGIELQTPHVETYLAEWEYLLSEECGGDLCVDIALETDEEGTDIPNCIVTGRIQPAVGETLVRGGTFKLFVGPLDCPWPVTVPDLSHRTGDILSSVIAHAFEVLVGSSGVLESWCEFPELCFDVEADVEDYSSLQECSFSGRTRPSAGSPLDYDEPLVVLHEFGSCDTEDAEPDGNDESPSIDSDGTSPGNDNDSALASPILIPPIVNAFGVPIKDVLSGLREDIVSQCGGFMCIVLETDTSERLADLTACTFTGETIPRIPETDADGTWVETPFDRGSNLVLLVGPQPCEQEVQTSEAESTLLPGEIPMLEPRVPHLINRP